MTQPATASPAHIIGRAPADVDAKYGYALNADVSTPPGLPPTVYVYARNRATGASAGAWVNLFVTPADARAFAAQLVAAADTIDPNGASQ